MYGLGSKEAEDGDQFKSRILHSQPSRQDSFHSRTCVPGNARNSARQWDLSSPERCQLCYQDPPAERMGVRLCLELRKNTSTKSITSLKP